TGVQTCALPIFGPGQAAGLQAEIALGHLLPHLVGDLAGLGLDLRGGRFQPLRHPFGPIRGPVTGGQGQDRQHRKNPNGVFHQYAPQPSSRQRRIRVAANSRAMPTTAPTQMSARPSSSRVWAAEKNSGICAGLSTSTPGPSRVSAQLPGAALSKPRKAIVYQRSSCGISTPWKMSVKLTRAQPSTGSMIAHRKGTRRAQAEQNI